MSMVKFFSLISTPGGIFLDISKAFDRVWHDELIYKIKCNGSLKHGKPKVYKNQYLSTTNYLNISLIRRILY